MRLIKVPHNDAWLDADHVSNIDFSYSQLTIDPKDGETKNSLNGVRVRFKDGWHVVYPGLTVAEMAEAIQPSSFTITSG